jgi:acetyl-CoA C-acetyltransferase
MACPAGMMATILGARALKLGDDRVVVVGGMDSMSTIPYLLKGARFEGFRMGDKALVDGWSDSMDPVAGVSMGMTAENLVAKYGIGREEMDVFAVASHHKAAAAQAAGAFDAELVPVALPAAGKQPARTFDKDESIRPDTSVAALARLRGAFQEGGQVTAGNACGMTDGAAALVLTTRATAKALGRAPLFAIRAYAVAAVDGRTMGEGPGVAIPKALAAAGRTLAEMDLIEVNEAFASQVLANERVLGWDRARLNVHGGAIALGHPTGCSGARLLVTLHHALARTGGTLGIAAICGGGGVTTAMVIAREG